jgi:hypothetical protein
MSFFMQLVNLTPHDITIGHMEKETFHSDRTIPPSGKVARVTSKETPNEPIDKVPVRAIEFIETENLPEPQKGVRYIVSMPVQQFATTRDDLVSPYSEKAFRDGAKILGVPGFVRYEPFTKQKASQEVTQEKTSSAFNRFVNLSYQPVTLQIGEEKREIPKSDKVAVVKTFTTESEALDNIPCYSIKFSDEIQNLPAKEEGVIYIVPMPVAQMAARSDCVSADTEKAIRDKGNIVAVPGFVRYI